MTAGNLLKVIHVELPRPAGMIQVVEMVACSTFCSLKLSANAARAGHLHATDFVDFVHGA